MPKLMKKDNDLKYDGSFLSWDKPLPKDWYWQPHSPLSNWIVKKDDLPLRFKEIDVPRYYPLAMKRNASMTWFVDRSFKGIVEMLEPNVHTFLPVDLLRQDESVDSDEFFLFQIGNVVDAIDKGAAGVYEKRIRPSMELYGYGFYRARDVYFEADKIKGLHLWAEVNLSDSIFFCSDEFSEKILEHEHPGVTFQDVNLGKSPYRREK